MKKFPQGAGRSKPIRICQAGIWCMCVVCETKESNQIPKITNCSWRQFAPAYFQTTNDRVKPSNPTVVQSDSFRWGIGLFLNQDHLWLNYVGCMLRYIHKLVLCHFGPLETFKIMTDINFIRRFCAYLDTLLLAWTG